MEKYNILRKMSKILCDQKTYSLKQKNTLRCIVVHTIQGSVLFISMNNAFCAILFYKIHFIPARITKCKG